MASLDLSDPSALPERSFTRYQPRNDPSDYPRRRNGSTFVSNLAHEEESGDGGGSVLNSMAERLESLNNQIAQTDEEAKQLVKSEYEAVAARSRQSASRESMELGSGGGGGRRGRQTSPEQVKRAQSPSSRWPARRPTTPNTWPRPRVSFRDQDDAPREARDSLRQRMAGTGARERQQPIQRPTQPELKVEVEPKMEPIAKPPIGLDAAIK